jgi:hypothetical protein
MVLPPVPSPRVLGGTQQRGLPPLRLWISESIQRICDDGNQVGRRDVLRYAALVFGEPIRTRLDCPIWLPRVIGFVPLISPNAIAAPYSSLL